MCLKQKVEFTAVQSEESEPITLSVNESCAQTLVDQQYTSGREYTWQSSFVIYIYKVNPLIKVIIYIETLANDTVFTNWNNSVKNAWSKKFSVKDNKGKIYPITVELVRSTSGFKNYTVECVEQDKAIGVRGLFGTESMLKWGCPIHKTSLMRWGIC